MKKIRLSRHARRRAKLYNIPEELVFEIVADMKLPVGEHTIVKHLPEYPYPLKIVLSVEPAMATVVTTYPLKKGRKK